MGQLEYEAAKHNVSTFMRAHTERVKRVWNPQDKASRPTLFMSDVDGTLKGSSAAAELDQFLCDLHDEGLPVVILSGRDPQPNAFEITKRLAANGDAWFVAKPMDIWEIAPGLIFDDDHSFIGALDYLGVTGLHPESPEVVAFLKSWVLLTPEDKAEILKPLTDFHKKIADVKVQTTMDPQVAELYAHMQELFEIDPAALIELRWLAQGLQTRVYRDYEPTLKHNGFLNADGTIPPAVAALALECIQENNGTWMLDPPRFTTPSATHNAVDDGPAGDG